MRLRRLAIAGFGRLSDRQLDFGPGLNVVYGPNEAGKSTVAAAVVASLYGIGRRKDDWRPWNGTAFATTLVYELSDGRTFEVQRDYARDAKGVRVYDADGNDVAGNVSAGRSVAPGEAHLRIPLEAFVNASCMLQQKVEIDGKQQIPVATALARALDGGPKEDAALGAVRRLEAARKNYVGTSRSPVNNPLRDAREAVLRGERAVNAARAARDALADARDRRAGLVAERARLSERRARAERDAQSVRAAELRDRLDALHGCRDDLAALRAARAEHDDVAAFPLERVPDFEAAFAAWQTAEGLAGAADAAAAEAAPPVADVAERRTQAADAGRLDEVQFAALRAAAEQAEAARTAAAAAAAQAAAARGAGDGRRRAGGIVLAVAAVCGAASVAAAIAHAWPLTEVFGVLAAVAFVLVAARARERGRATRGAADKQRAADAALGVERVAASAVAAVLTRVGATSIDDLVRRRERLAELDRAAGGAARLAARAADARASANAAAAQVDALRTELLPDETGSRRAARSAVLVRAARRRARDGIDNGIAMLNLRRSEILRGDDEFALVAERDALAAAGIVAITAAARGTGDDVAELGRRIQAADVAIAQLTGELEHGETAAADLAALEDDLEQCRSALARLEALDRALELAAVTVEQLAHEAHQAFARRLETYVADGLRSVTGGRYAEIRVDPKTLAVRARVPENGAIVDIDALSAGTRDQVYLVVRFAMARMFAEGLETPPLLLDDPFAFWDEARLERCLPLVAHNAFDAQTILFTASPGLATAAEQFGALRIDLAPSLAVY